MGRPSSSSQEYASGNANCTWYVCKKIIIIKLRDTKSWVVEGGGWAWVELEEGVNMIKTVRNSQRTNKTRIQKNK